MNLGRQLREFFSEAYETIRCRHEIGRTRMFFSYLGYRATNLLGGSKVTSIGPIRMNTPDYGNFLYLFSEIFIHRCYRFKTSNPAPRILDCGGNIGMSLAYFKTLYPKARIDVFEPDPLTYPILESNIRLNHWNDCQAHPVAVAREEGELSFHREQKVAGGLGNSINPQRTSKASWEEVTVKAVRLSGFIDGPIDLLKLDIEGAETGVLQELAASGKIGMIELMLIEYHHHLDKQADEFSQFLAILETNGFGYQLSTSLTFPTYGRRFQDVMVMAYRK